jgi:hypothetical protein
MFKTEYEFELPKGYMDKDGNLHKKGIMRLATAADEILPLKDPRVMQNPAFLSILLLTRVIVKLGPLSRIDNGVIESLYIGDLNFLKEMYQQINMGELHKAKCPHCKKQFNLPEDFFARPNF